MTGASEVDDRRQRSFTEAPALRPLVARSLLRRGHRPAALPAVEYVQAGRRMDADALARYQRVCGFDVGSVVPATFVHVQAFGLATALMAEPGFPFPLLGLIHVADRITQARPIDVGEPLDLRVWAADLRDHPAGRQVDLCTVAEISGEPVLSEVSTYLHRSGPAPARAPRAGDAPPAPTAVWRLPADLGRRYAAVSGDYNPIHLSKIAARAFGFPRAIAHGMWLNARLLAALAPRLPAHFTVDIAFKTPALLPSAVAFDAGRLGTAPGADGWAVSVRAARTGRPHLSGTVAPG